MHSAFDRLNKEAEAIGSDPHGYARALLAVSSPDGYRRWLSSLYGFVYPLERSLSDTVGLEPFLDKHRMRRHVLIEHDLRSLGLRPLELESLPQCMWIPWFVDVHEALGWAYAIERIMLEHNTLFRHVAAMLPGEAAFSASYLTCQAGALGEMWRRFEQGLVASLHDPADLERVVLGCRAGFRHLRRWRHLVNGTARTTTRSPTLAEASGAEPAAPSRSRCAPRARSAAEDA